MILTKVIKPRDSLSMPYIQERSLNNCMNSVAAVLSARSGDSRGHKYSLFLMADHAVENLGSNLTIRNITFDCVVSITQCESVVRKCYITFKIVAEMLAKWC